MEYKLGERILVNIKLIRYTSESLPNLNDRIWTQQSIEQKSVIVVGKRSLKNGNVEWYEDGPTVFIETGRVSALIVAERIDRKHFLVPALREWPRVSSPEWEDRLPIGDGFVYGTRRSINECQMLLLNGQRLQDMIRNGMNQ